MQIINKSRGFSIKLPLMGFGCGFGEITGRVPIHNPNPFDLILWVSGYWVLGVSKPQKRNWVSK